MWVCWHGTSSMEPCCGFFFYGKGILHTESSVSLEFLMFFLIRVKVFSMGTGTLHTGLTLKVPEIQKMKEILK
jgi:hypothetical protein